MLDLYKRRYDRDTYNCGHFVIDFLREVSDGFNVDNRDVQTLRNLQKINEPESPSIVMMRSSRRDLHCGVFYKNKVVHLIESGVRADDLSDLTEFKIDFFKCPQSK